MATRYSDSQREVQIHKATPTLDWTILSSKDDI